MFIFKLSSWLDSSDPYWYSRFLALKVSYLTIILFLANALLQPPIAPSFIMIIAISGILLIESPQINDFNKKDNVYLVYTIIVLLTIAIFSLNVYLKSWFILVAFAWCYLLYSLFKKAPAMFPVVSLILMLGLMSLESPYNPANPYIVLNQILYFSEFSIIVFWAHKCFPNLYLQVWKSVLLRCIENYQQGLKNNQFDHGLATKHYLALKNVLPLLICKHKIYALVRFSNLINECNYAITALSKATDNERESVATQLQILYQSILKNKPIEFREEDSLAKSLTNKQLNNSQLAAKSLIYVRKNKLEQPLQPNINIPEQLMQQWNKICMSN